MTASNSPLDREPLMEEHDPEVRVLVVGFDYEAAVHVGVAARFVNDELPYVIEVLHSVQAFVEHGVPVDGGHATADDAERLARCVVIPCADCDLRVQDPKAVRAAARSHRAWPTLLKTIGPSGDPLQSRASSICVASSQSKAPARCAWIRSPASSLTPSIVSTTTLELPTNRGASSAISGSKAPTAAMKMLSGISSGNTGSWLVVAVTIRLSSCSARESARSVVREVSKTFETPRPSWKASRWERAWVPAPTTRSGPSG